MCGASHGGSCRAALYPLAAVAPPLVHDAVGEVVVGVLEHGPPGAALDQRKRRGRVAAARAGQEDDALGRGLDEDHPAALVAVV